MNTDKIFVKKISRKEFLKFIAKILATTVLFSILPFKLFGSDKYLHLVDKIGKIFAIPIKPFRRSDLYRKHNLLG
jgi:hypothetical protein